MTELRINGWNSKNLRIPENAIEINTDCQITFILMPNGHGKTTTHQLIYFALRNWINEVYMPTPKGPVQLKEWVKSLRKKGSTKDTGEFNLHFSYGKKSILISCKFYLDTGAFVRAYKRNSKDIGYADLDTSLRDLIDRRSADFMLVDGEQADTFVDGSAHEDRRPKNVISVMHRLNELGYIKDLYSIYYEDESDREQKKGDKGQHTASKNRLKKAINTLKDREKRKLDVVDDIKEKEKNITKLEDEESGLSSGTSYERKIEEEKKKESKQYEKREEYNRLANSIFTTDLLSINPDFTKSIRDLWDCLETCKLPENAAADWFIELSKRKTCVCGRKIEPVESKLIKDTAKNFLSGNHQNQLNQIKDSVRDFCEGSKDTDEPSEELDGYLKNAAKCYSKGHKHKTEAKRYAELAAKESGNDKRLEEIEIEKLSTQGDIEELRDQETDLDDIKTESASIAWAEDQVEQAKDDFRSHKKMFKLFSQKELLEDLFEDLQGCVLKKICNGIVIRTNESISDMIGDKTMEIKEIGEDRLILKSGSKGGSKGQNLALGYAFLEAVYSPMDFSLPLIIDSPIGKIDTLIRPDVAELIWKLNRQMVILLIDTEKEAFISIIKNLAIADGKSDKIEYITQFNITKKTKPIVAKLPGVNLISGSKPVSYLTKNEKAFEEFRGPKK